MRTNGDRRPPTPHRAAWLLFVLALLAIAVIAIVQWTRGDPASGSGDPPITPAPGSPPPLLPVTRDPRVAALRRRLRRAQRQLTAEQQIRRTRVTVGSGQWLTRAFLCIHHYEGSWTDGAAPYWGGLQMDRNFMASYGGPFYREWGTADHWPAFVQVAVAMRAYFVRGFEPWPNTSRSCGLR